MQFTMKNGILFDVADRQVRAVLKGVFCKLEKRVFTGDGKLVLRTDIRKAAESQAQPGDIRAWEYVVFTSDGAEVATAQPRYSAKDDPDRAGWPIFHLPRVNHAYVFWSGRKYRLNVSKNQDYTLLDSSHRTVVEFRRKGLLRGWAVEVMDGFPAELLCTIYVFCQYLIQENELHVV